MTMLVRLLILVLAALPVASWAVMKTIQAGATDQTVSFVITDESTGIPSTDLTFASSGIDLEYWRHGANSPVDITEATQTVNGAHSDGGFVHIGAGRYRLDLPDAAVASGATAVDVYGVITGEIIYGGTVQLVAYNPQDSTPQVDVVQWLGTAAATPTVAGVPEVDITHFGGTAGTFASGRPNVNTSHVAGTSQTAGDLAALITTADSVIDNVLTYIQTNLGLLGANATEAGGNGDHLTEAGGTGDQFTGQPWNASWDTEVQSEVTDALNVYDPPTNTEMTTAIDALPTAAENATEHLTQQRVLTGTCDSGSTTTCVDDALTQANTSQLDDRLICFSDSWCALITDFTPGTDTVTTTKVAPATRGSLGYTIFPATAQ